jgi:hypothetical protein
MSSLSANRSNPMISTVAMLVGAVFLLVGILGFVPGITTHYGDLQFAGHDSGAKLIGLFQVSILHNIVHLLFGVAGIAASRASASAARSYLVGGGVIYLVLWIYGLVIGMDSKANFVPVNNADNWLHLILGIGMVGLGLALGRTVSSPARTSSAVR